MSKPRILYLNLCAGKTVTASATDSGYPAVNTTNWKEYELWKASGANTYTLELDYGANVAATALALAGHNGYTCGARFKLEGKVDGGGGYVSVLGYETFANNFTLARFFDSVSYRYWKLTIDNNGGANFAPQVGIYYIGTYLEMEQKPETPLDPDATQDVGNVENSGSGYLLGSVLDHSLREQSWQFKYLTQSWILNTWIPFINSYRNQPFFFAWDVGSHPNEVYLMRFKDTRFGAPYEIFFRNLSFSLTGRKEE